MNLISQIFGSSNNTNETPVGKLSQVIRGTFNANHKLSEQSVQSASEMDVLNDAMLIFNRAMKEKGDTTPEKFGELIGSAKAISLAEGFRYASVSLGSIAKKYEQTKTVARAACLDKLGGFVQKNQDLILEVKKLQSENNTVYNQALENESKEIQYSISKLTALKLDQLVSKNLSSTYSITAQNLEEGWETVDNVETKNVEPIKPIFSSNYLETKTKPSLVDLVLNVKSTENLAFNAIDDDML